MIPARRLAISLACVVALGGVGVTGCGGADGTPASTTRDGVAVYDPEHNVLDLTAGPRVIISMPNPGAGTEWRLMSAPDDMGGVSLKGMAAANGAGEWLFDTIGAGSGTLEFQKWTPGSDEPSYTVTYEVNVK